MPILLIYVNTTEVFTQTYTFQNIYIFKPYKPDMYTLKDKITGILLAGGKSSRMGQDKAKMLFKGKSLAQWSMEALRPLCTSIIVSSNNLNHISFGNKIVPDVTWIQGPLSGLAAALETSQTEINIVLACDTPNVQTKHLKKLLDALENYDASVLVCESGQVHPLIGCYKTNVLSTIKAGKETKRHSLMHLLDHLNYKKVTLPDARISLNINSNEDIV